jgi:NADH-quinone oxidoreductase subunit J
MNMPSLFYMAAAIAVFSTLMMLTRLNAVHALLYLIVSLLAVAVVFYSLGAPFIAALEIIIYAGAIMVLFVFVVMLLNLGERATELERSWVRPRMYVGPAILAALLLAEMVIMLLQTHVAAHSIAVGPKEVGTALYGPYLIGVELASMLLLGALVGAYHLGAGKREAPSEGSHADTYESRTVAGGDLIRAGTDRTVGAAQSDFHPDVH